LKLRALEMNHSILGQLNKRSQLALSWLLLLAGISMALILSIAFSGCGSSNPYPPGSFDRAKFFVDNDNDLEAVAALESFVRHNPTDSLAAEAQYLKSMVYMDMGEYPLAAVEFQILQKDYPTDDRVEDAFFQEGMAYYKQVGAVRRDVTGAYEARLHFLKFSQEFPNSQHLPEVLQHMAEISDLMVRKRLEQAKVFWQLKRYKAIEVTLNTALEDEGGSTLLDEVMWERARALVKLDDVDEAAAMYEGIINGYPDSDFFDRAQSALRKLDEDEADYEDQD